jgi:UDPglucose--hexose-1-phosphate uridylyltransferase
LQDYLQEELKLKGVLYLRMIILWHSFWYLALWNMIISKRHLTKKLPISQKLSCFCNILKQLTINTTIFWDLISLFVWFTRLQLMVRNIQNGSFMHFYPPLLRSATVKKFMVGYEMMGITKMLPRAEFLKKPIRSPL